jgi:hypothetical protein
MIKDTQEKAVQDKLSDLLHKIGSIIHYQEFQNNLTHDENQYLYNTLFLNPEWITKAVYKLVRDNSEEIRKNAARFERRQLNNYWKSYPPSQFPTILSIIKRFDLCFQLEHKDTYILPQLLTDTPHPAIKNFDKSPSITRFLYDYDGIIPAGMIARFICKQHNRIKKEDKKFVYWREGVLLEREGCLALIRKRLDKSIIEVILTGQNRRDFLSIIRESFHQLHESLNNLKPIELIQCNCEKCHQSSEPYFYKYHELLVKLRNNIDEFCIESEKKVNTGALIEETIGNYQEDLYKELIQRNHIENTINIPQTQPDHSLTPKPWYKEVWVIFTGISIFIAALFSFLASVAGFLQDGFNWTFKDAWQQLDSTNTQSPITDTLLPKKDTLIISNDTTNHKDSTPIKAIKK